MSGVNELGRGGYDMLTGEGKSIFLAISSPAIHVHGLDTFLEGGFAKVRG